jgi:hypothetical protein
MATSRALNLCSEEAPAGIAAGWRPRDHCVSKLLCIFSTSWSMLKLDGRWLGGYSLKVARNGATMA